MSGVQLMLAASSESSCPNQESSSKNDGKSACEALPPRKPPQSVRALQLPAHSFPSTPAKEEASCENEEELFGESALDRNPDLWMYRKRTVVLLHRYLRYSLETGRIPSILGCEFFRSAVTTYNVTTFEDRVVFVHDVESCLQKLDEFARQVIARVVLEEHRHDAAARLLHCSRRKLERELFDSLDRLSELFLEVKLLVANLVPQKWDEYDEDEE